MNRRTFIGSAAAFATLGVRGATKTPSLPSAYAAIQAEIDDVTPAEYAAHLAVEGTPAVTPKPALARYDAAFARALAEMRATTVSGRPAVWYVYNMGLLVKTPQTRFAIDLCHRNACDAAKDLDFTLITHNHDDHYTERFVRLLDRGLHKTVVSNFLDNYGATRVKGGFGGGYARHSNTFVFGDVKIRTALSDHNAYLVDFTTTFEIETNGYRIYHTGDSGNLEKLKPSAAPDLWCVHPRCGVSVAEGIKRFHPRSVAILHLNELGHARDRWRWSYADGFEQVGFCQGLGVDVRVPLWGERLV